MDEGEGEDDDDDAAVELHRSALFDDDFGMPFTQQHCAPVFSFVDVTLRCIVVICGSEFYRSFRLFIALSRFLIRTLVFFLFFRFFRLLQHKCSRHSHSSRTNERAQIWRCRCGCCSFSFLFCFSSCLFAFVCFFRSLTVL